MLTSVSDESVMNECQQAGIAGYIIKPITAEDGPEVLMRYLNI
jgi:AmiR/NasT family two-component response regulator